MTRAERLLGPQRPAVDRLPAGTPSDQRYCTWGRTEEPAPRHSPAPRRKLPEIVRGSRFGRLVALHQVGSIDRKSRWRFACDCGNEAIVRSASVKAGLTRSCGCLRERWVREQLEREESMR